MVLCHRTSLAQTWCNTVRNGECEPIVDSKSQFTSRTSRRTCKEARHAFDVARTRPAPVTQERPGYASYGLGRATPPVIAPIRPSHAYYARRAWKFGFSSRWSSHFIFPVRQPLELDFHPSFAPSLSPSYLSQIPRHSMVRCGHPNFNALNTLTAQYIVTGSNSNQPNPRLLRPIPGLRLRSKRAVL